jgi:NADH-quinone oxidoreductase subunit H
MLAAAFKTFVLLGIAFTVLLPLALLLERRHHTLLRERIGTSQEDVDPDASVWEFLRPLGNALWLLVEPAPRIAGPHRFLRELAPALALVAAMLGLGVVPFGVGPYVFGEAHVAMVVADLDWGLLGLAIALGFSQLADILASFASGSPAARLASLQGTLRMLAGTLGLVLSGLALVLCVGSLGLSEIVTFQDASFRALGVLDAVVVEGGLPAWLAWLRLPSWGVFVQPLGFFLFLRCAWIATTRPAPILDERQDASQLRSGALLSAAYLERIVWSSAIVALFLGGGAAPYIEQGSIIAFVAQGYGEGFATGFAMLVHGGIFFAKVAVVLAALTHAHGRFAAPDHATGMRELSGVILPLAAFNIVVTALVVRWWEGVLA